MTVTAVKSQPVVAAKPSRMAAPLRKGRMPVPMRLFVHGIPKVGKSTFAQGAPDPVWLGADAGTEELDVARFPQPECWADVFELLARARTEDFKTLVVDPVNWFEPMCWAQVCKNCGVQNIEEVGGGFSKGYNVAVDEWRRFLLEVERVWQSGKNIIFIAHTEVKNFKNPEGEDYERYQIAMHPKAAGLLMGWVDAILFARHETTTTGKGGKKSGKVRGVSTGARVLHTQYDAAYDAGNRWSLPCDIPLGWHEFQAAVQESRTTAEALRTEIRTKAAELGGAFPAKADALFLKTGDDIPRLREALNSIDHKLQLRSAEEKSE